jgi:hypothetical protein
VRDQCHAGDSQLTNSALTRRRGRPPSALAVILTCQAHLAHSARLRRSSTGWAWAHVIAPFIDTDQTRCLQLEPGEERCDLLSRPEVGLHRRAGRHRPPQESRPARWPGFTLRQRAQPTAASALASGSSTSGGVWREELDDGEVGAHVGQRGGGGYRRGWVAFRTIRTLPDGSELVMLRESDGMRTRRRRGAGDPHAPQLPGTTARLVTFTITARTRSGRTKATLFRVLTTLRARTPIPPARSPALYAERWTGRDRVPAPGEGRAGWPAGPGPPARERRRPCGANAEVKIGCLVAAWRRERTRSMTWTCCAARRDGRGLRGAAGAVDCGVVPGVVHLGQCAPGRQGQPGAADRAGLPCAAAARRVRGSAPDRITGFTSRGSR